MRGWSLIYKDFTTQLELWKTPSRYLICNKYAGIFHFFDSRAESYTAFRMSTNKEIEND